MPQTAITIILVLNIFTWLTQAAVVRNQVPQPFNNKNDINNNSNNYQQNSLEEPRFAARTKAEVKDETAAKYDAVNSVSNHVLDNFDHRYPDGSYEFRYELADGQARYERGYFIKVNNHKSLVVVGYYSYRMPNGKYITVFYNADQYGYRQNQAITRENVPDLPRSIEVPAEREVQDENIAVTTRKSSSYSSQVSSTTKRNHI